MKPTLNEEIGISQEAIDYVNSLEVKEEYHVIENAFKVFQENYDKSKENERIKKQSQKVWGFVFVAIVIIVTYFLNR